MVRDDDPDPGEPVEVIGAVGRDDQALHSAGAGRERPGKHAARAADATVEPELADEGRAGQGTARHLLAGGEHPDGDRQVEPRALLADLGR